MYQNYTRKAEREERRRREDREAFNGCIVILLLFVMCLGFVAACMRAIIISAERYELPVAVVQEVEEDHFREVTKMIEEEPCPLAVSEFYDVPLGIELQAHIINECGGYEVDPAIVFAMIERESRFKADAVGDSGKSFGLMQIQPRWHEARMERLGVSDLLNPYENVMVGIDFLAEQIDRYDGDVAKALTAYNMGHYPGEITAYAKGVMERSEELKVVTADVLF